jgi:hypothetical protein
MPLSLPTAMVLAGLWTLGCATLAMRVFAARVRGRLQFDQFLNLLALGSLGIAPWISIIVYYSGDDGNCLAGLANVAVAVIAYLAGLRARKARLNPSAVPVSSMPFQQKSATLMLMTLVVVYGVYAWLTLQMPGLVLPLFFAAAVLVSVIATVGHVGMALLHVPNDGLNTPADQRDRAAERYAASRAYYVLALGLWIVPVVSVMKMNLLVVANTAFLFIVLAEIVKYASIVRYYWRGES